MPSEPRAYGEPTDRGYEQAMDALTDAVSYSRGNEFEQIKAVAKTLTEEAWRAAGSPADGGLAALFGAVAKELPRSEPCYVEEDAQDLLLAASASLVIPELRPEDVPWPRGFVYLFQPIPGLIPEGDVIAFSWATVDYVDRGEVLVTMSYIVERGRITWARPGFTTLDTPAVVDDMIGMGSDSASRLLVAFFLLARQRIFVDTTVTPSRAVRRRAQGRIIQTVRVVYLRKRDYPETGGIRTVEWSHRWLTRGHWRNQWFPSEQRHRPTWVSPYVKGPADKPFVAKRRAFEFVR